MSQRRFSADGEICATRGGRSDAAKDWLSLLLPPLAIVGTLAGFWLIFQAAMTMPPAPLPRSPLELAAAFSATPIASGSSVTPEPLVVFVITATPDPTPAPILWQTATVSAQWTAEAPQPCPDSRQDLAALPAGTLCRQPTLTVTPAPTSTPLSVCDPANWHPNDLCMTSAPFVATPTIAIATAGSER